MRISYLRDLLLMQPKRPPVATWSAEAEADAKEKIWWLKKQAVRWAAVHQGGSAEWAFFKEDEWVQEFEESFVVEGGEGRREEVRKVVEMVGSLVPT